jgi:E1A/CREB-binding protein
MRKEGVYKIPLAQFVGNRFNIIFYDAAGVYYLHDHMAAFIEKVHGKEANRLLQAVLADLKNPANIAGCRALGIIDKLVTGPLWRKLQESSASVLHMSSVYSRAKNKFDVWSANSSCLLEGRDCLEDGCIHEDNVWKALIEPSESTDVMTQELLQLLFGAFSKTTQRLLLDHLPGGMYNSITDSSLIEETVSVPTTNVAPERDFAVLDRMMREKPNAHLIAIEAMILYSHNKSAHWLELKSCEERERLFQAARTLAPVIREKFKSRN